MWILPLIAAGLLIAYELGFDPWWQARRITKLSEKEHRRRRKEINRILGLNKDEEIK